MIASSGGGVCGPNGGAPMSPATGVARPIRSSVGGQAPRSREGEQWLIRAGPAPRHGGADQAGPTGKEDAFDRPLLLWQPAHRSSRGSSARAKRSLRSGYCGAAARAQDVSIETRARKFLLNLCLRPD